jgi:two-component system, cell cycle sensor histidine kinase and response regulator CckA
MNRSDLHDHEIGTQREPKDSFMTDGGFTSILDALPSALLTLDRDGTITSANRAFIDLLGTDPVENSQTNSVYSLLPLNEIGAEKYFRNLIENSQPLEFDSLILRNKSGDRLFLQCRGIPVYGHNKNYLYYLLLFIDISEQKKLAEQYRQAQRLEAIGKLAGGLAHDFNNILTVIQGNCARLTLNMEETHPDYEYVRQIDISAKRAESLIQKLLAFSRQQLLQPKILDLNHLIQSMKTRLEQILGERIQLILTLKDIYGSIKADPAQLEQVFINLVYNSRDAMPQGGKVIIETMNVILDDTYIKKHPMVRPGSYIMLAISDTGVGMQDKIKAHVFEPFFSTKDKGKGTGMGLATVYGIIKQSDGFVWVYSEAGKGTTFKIYLPQVEEKIGPSEKTVSTDQSLRGYETILVIDDEKEVRELVSEMLRFYGYSVLEAPNASNAFTIYERHKNSIDLILTDIVMPQMSGIEFANKIRPLYPRNKFLFMSGFTDTVLAEQELLKDQVHFLQKPFNAVTLMKKIRTVLDKNND